MSKLTKQQVTNEATRQQFSAEFKQQALIRAAKDGVVVAARELGIRPAQVYAWRGKAR